MQRERSEIIAFTRDDIERLVRYVARERVTASLFIGKFGNQTVRWLADGAIEVITTYSEGDLPDLPPAPEPAKLEKKKKR